MRLFNTVATASFISSVIAVCNPLTSGDCDPNPALASSFKEDFTSKSKYFDELKSKGLSYGDEGISFSLKDRFDNPSIKSNFYMMFGKVEVVMKAAPGQGVVSSFYLQSDDLDEIDIEFFGGDKTQVQSNFFAKGDTTTYTRGGYHNTPGDPTDEFMTYTVDWTEDQLSWAVNGDVVRTLKPDDPEGYPQSPMALYAGIWAGGDPSNPQGTIEWAGGETTYGPTYTMVIKSLVVTDYSTGKAYKYSDQSGDWESIELIDGQINGRKSQGQEEFEKLQEGEVIENSYSATSSPSSSASSATTSTVSSTGTITSTSTTSKTTSHSSSLSTSSTKKTTSTKVEPTSTEAKTTEASTTKKSETKTTEVVSHPTKPITENESTTVWWTPTQTVWWTPSATDAKTEDATETTTSKTSTASEATTGPITIEIPSTLATIARPSSSSESSSTSSSVPESTENPTPEILGSLDSGASSKTPFFFAIVIPMVFLVI